MNLTETIYWPSTTTSACDSGIV